MKKFLSVCFCCFVLSGVSQATAPDDVTGTWATHDEKAHVKIFQRAGVFNGRIVWLKSPVFEDGAEKTDRRNPDPAKQKHALMDMQILNGMIFEKDHWANGTIYDPENGKTYSLTIWKKDSTLELRGYSGSSLIGRIQTWRKVK